MGSFSIACAASEMTVGYGVEVYLFPLFPTKHHYLDFPTSIVSNDGAFIKNTVGPPLRGKYDDYGRVAIDDEQNPLVDAIYREAYGDDYKDVLWNIMDREGRPHEKFCVIIKDFWDNLVKYSNENEHINNEYLKAESFVAYGFEIKPFEEQHLQASKDHRKVDYYKQYQLEHPDSDIIAFGNDDYLSEMYYNKKTDSYHKMKNKYDCGYKNEWLAETLGTEVIYPSPKMAQAMHKIKLAQFELAPYKNADDSMGRFLFSNIPPDRTFGILFHAFDNDYYEHNRFVKKSPMKYKDRTEMVKDSGHWAKWLLDQDLMQAVDLMSEFSIVYDFMHSNNKVFENKWCGPQCPEHKDELIFHQAAIATLKTQMEDYMDESEIKELFA